MVWCIGDVVTVFGFCFEIVFRNGSCLFVEMEVSWGAKRWNWRVVLSKSLAVDDGAWEKLVEVKKMIKQAVMMRRNKRMKSFGSMDWGYLSFYLDLTWLSNACAVNHIYLLLDRPKISNVTKERAQKSETVYDHVNFLDIFFIFYNSFCQQNYMKRFLKLMRSI